jgi:hypothetical protein
MRRQAAGDIIFIFGAHLAHTSQLYAPWYCVNATFYDNC